MADELFNPEAFEQMPGQMSMEQTVPGECVAVCAACGARVVVPPMAGIGPWLRHKAECPRDGWPIREAIAYDDGTQATISNWVQR